MTGIALTVAGVAGLVLFGFLLWNLLDRGERATRMAAGWDREWFEDFSAFRYLPMRRLLSHSEEAFLEAHPHGARIDRRRFRAERRMLFRLYLSDLEADFSRLNLGAKMAILAATEDQSALVAQLLRLEWELRRAVWQAHWQLFVHALGLRPVESTVLIDVLQHFEFSLREVALAHTHAHAPSTVRA